MSNEVRRNNPSISQIKQATKTIYEENKTLKKALQCIYKLYKEIHTKAQINIEAQDFNLSQIVDFLSEYATQSMQVEKKLKCSEEKLKTVLYDYTAREKLLMQDINQLHSAIDTSKVDTEHISNKVKIMEKKFTSTIKDKNQIIQKLCTQLQKCSVELKNSAQELLGANQKKALDSLHDNREILSDIKATLALSPEECKDMEYQAYIKSLEASTPASLFK